MFEQAVREGGGPRALAQLAFAEQAIGAWVEAATHLDEALAHVDDPWIEAHRAVLDEARATIAQHVGRLDVLVEPADAEVSVDGRSLGAGPVQGAAVLAGEVVLEVSAPGYVMVQRTEHVDAALITRVRFRLVPEAPAEEAIPVADAPRDVAERSAAPFDATGLHTAAVVVGAVGLLVVAGLAVSLGVREVNVLEYNACAAPMSVTCEAQYETGRAAELAAGALGATAGAALIGAGAILLVSLVLEGQTQ